MEGGEDNEIRKNPSPETESSSTQPLLDTDPTQYRPISFLPNPRPFKDLAFLTLFLLISISTLILGICAIALKNPNFSRVSSFKFDPKSSSCVLPDQNSFNSSSFPPQLIKNLILVVIVTVLLSFPIILIFLWFLKSYPKQILYSLIPFSVIIPIIINIYWFVACSMRNSCRESFPLAYRILILIFVFVVIATLAWIIAVNWYRVEMTSRIIGIAAEGLSQNLGILSVLPFLLLGLVIYCVLLGFFMVFARQNGKIVPERLGEGDFVCKWGQDGWVPAYYVLVIVEILWCLAVMIEAHVYVISGTIANWYFYGDEDRPRRMIRSSLRNAFGPSFGTVCFSGLVMPWIRVVRAIVDSAEQNDGQPGCVNMVLRCCSNFFLSAIHFVNKFTINFAAITGEAYCSSANMAYELLKRNLLSAVFVETVSTRILLGVSFVISAIYAILAWVILRSASSLGLWSYVVAGSSFMVLMAALGFLTHVLDEVIDTVYVCFAIDRDKGEVSRQEVHSVYMLLPLSRSSTTGLPSRSPLLA